MWRSVGFCAVICSLLFAPRPARALDPSRSLTQYVHRIWQMQQGLPHATIFSILQTRNGYIWLGTPAGLVRFDGVRFAVPDEIAGGALKNLWVEALVEDNEQNLWISASGSGLMRWREGILTRYSTAQGLPSPNVRCLMLSRSGELWAGTAQGPARYNGGRFVSQPISANPARNNVTAATEAADGSLWFGGDSTLLSRWDGTRFSSYQLGSLPGHTVVHALLGTRDGSLWIGTSQGLVRLKQGKEQRFTTANGLADNWVLSLMEGREGGLWIGTNNGFSRFANDEFETFQTRNGLSQSTVYALREDRRGDLWVGTKHGLNQFLEGRSISYSASEGFPSNDAGPVIQDRNGTIWAGTLNAGLAQFDGRRFSVLGKRQGLVSKTIHALATDAGGDLWVGTNAGLERVQDGRIVATYTTAQGLPSNSVRSLFRDAHGVLWAGTQAGPAILRHGIFIAPEGARQIGRAAVLAFAEDRQSRLLMAIENDGLYVYENGAFRPMAPEREAPRDVDAVYQDRDGLLWAGTVGSGLWLFKNGKFFRFLMKDGLFDDEIYGITEDDRDELWMACSKGVFSVKRADLLRFAKGDIREFASTPYSPLDALRTIECRSGVQPSLWKMRDGRIWFSTIRGLLLVDPRSFARKLEAPSTVLESVIVNGRPADFKELSELPPGQNNLEFRYTGLSFVLPGRISFRYMLEGFDKHWADAGNRRAAQYANLAPGKYVFRVLACNPDGTCDEKSSSVAFAIAPYFYQRRSFIALLVASLAASALLWHRLRLRRVRDRFGLILAERSRIARELHDTLIQGFSGVTMQMQAVCARLSSPEEIRTLNEIIRDAANCLHEARLSVAGLRSAGSNETGLAAAIAQAAREMTEAKDIRLKLMLDSLPGDMPENLEYNLFRIAKEAMNNAVQHSGARTLEVALRREHGEIRLVVRDDGSGLPASHRVASSSGHYGVIGMRERAKSIGATLDIESRPGRGTSIVLRAPMPRTEPNSARSSALNQEEVST